jgi:hypothetical protein
MVGSKQKNADRLERLLSSPKGEEGGVAQIKSCCGGAVAVLCGSSTHANPLLAVPWHFRRSIPPTPPTPPGSAQQ